MRIHNVFHVGLLEPYAVRAGTSVPDMPMPPEDAEDLEQEDDANDDARPLVRRPIARKYGIAFTSSAKPSQDELDSTNEERAMVPMHPDREEAVQEAVQGKRFVKPTGKAIVMDDKHMYV